MPELPEVETTRRLVEPHLVGRRIVDIAVPGGRVLRRQEQAGDFAARLLNRRIDVVDRHGKFLEIGVSGDLVWVVHLGMTGRLAIVSTSALLEPHTRLIVSLDSGDDLRFVDPRTFGFAAVYTPTELAESSIAALGPDALADLPRAPALRTLLQGRTAPIKALLLDQRLIAGIGNIYADEVLHRARLAPERPAGSLTAPEVGRLRSSIRVVLAAALDAGGTSLADLAYLLPDGRSGDYRMRLRVYGREGEACLHCGGRIVRSVVRGRSTYWCRGCQH